MPHDRPRRIDGYIRVSRVAGREGASYQSPGNQRTAIERWSAYREVPIDAWHIDEDQSGGTHDRPGLLAAIQRISAGETDGIACFNIDRFSRSTELGLADIRRINDLNAHVVFVSDEIDTTVPGGRLHLRTLLSQGEYFLDNIKAGWWTAKTNAIARGAAIGPTNVGYTRGPDGIYDVDPMTAPAIADAMRVCGSLGVPQAVRLLRDRIPDMTWTTFTVKRLLSNDVYLGIARYGNLVNATAHPPLVTRVEFEAAQAMIAEATGPGRRSAELFPLSGIAECAACGAHLVGGRGGVDARRTYRCSAKCPEGPVITAAMLEEHVTDRMRHELHHGGFRIGARDDDSDLLLAALQEAELELDEFASDLTARKTLGDRYHHHLTLRAEAVEEARRRLHEAIADRDTVEVLDLVEAIDSLTPDEMSIVLRSILDTVLVRRGRGLSVAERVVVIPKGLDRPDTTRS